MPRSPDPQFLRDPPSAPRALGRLAAVLGLIIAASVGAAIALFATGKPSEACEGHENNAGTAGPCNRSAGHFIDRATQRRGFGQRLLGAQPSPPRPRGGVTDTEIRLGSIIAGLTALVTGTMTFTVVRFLLGAAEAGFFPGILLYFTYWFPSHHHARIVSGFMIGLPIAVAAGAPISTALLDLDGMFGLRGWQIMYIAEAVPTVVIGILTLFLLTDRRSYRSGHGAVRRFN
jgi:MFS family permease